MEPRNRAIPGCRRAPNTRKATSWIPLWRGVYGPGGVGDLWHAWKHCERNPGGPASGLTSDRQVRMVNLWGTTVMDGCRESDRFIVCAWQDTSQAGSSPARPGATG